MATKSAGILFFRKDQELKVLLVHPGGPFHVNKDEGAWSIPKGEIHEEENYLAAALREAEEETGIRAGGYFIELTPVVQRAGKIVYAWANKTEFDVSGLKSNLFEIEWPPKSGKMKSFPEVDRAEWFTIREAKTKILSGQLPLITELRDILDRS